MSGDRMSNVAPFMKPEDFDWTLPPGWNRTKGFLTEALEYERGLYTLDDVLAGIRKQELQFWPADKSALVTAIVDHPREKQLDFWLAGGDLAELKQLAAFVESWAVQRMGVTCAKITGRKGWLVLGDEWEEVATVMVKRLSK